MQSDLDSYYQQVQTIGKLRTPDHARRWSTAVLNTLGDNIDGRTKGKLAKALPDELAHDLTRVFRFKRFVYKDMLAWEFQNQVARRSGNTDPQFARFPVLAVFHAIKSFADNDLGSAVAEALPTEVSALWQQA
jgi:uncharacterized protein (DUF2267 family)